MPVITVFSGIYCNEENICRQVAQNTGYRLITDKPIMDEAARMSDLTEAKIERVFSGETSVFNKFTHERQRAVAYLRLAVAGMISEDNLLISGFASQLIPKNVSHVLRVCLIADMKFRITRAAEEEGSSEKDALRRIRSSDADAGAWVAALFHQKDPWDSALYDIVIPVDKTGLTETVALIIENAGKDVVKLTPGSKKTMEDFLLAARTEVALAKEGHDVTVTAADAGVTLTINKKVLMLKRLEKELKAIARQVPGVKTVETKVGPTFHKADIYRKYDFSMPAKVLLVDDEREFVQTLSERLLLRDMGSAVVYDGESALNLVQNDEPEVMILDLKMPGIDGIEVLRRVKESNPHIEVIILTGHGSEADRQMCMQLGAFAYLQKPVDIELLSETLKKAKEKMRGGK